MGDRRFVAKPNPDEHPFPWIVISRRSHNGYEKPHSIEAWPNKQQAMICGKFRHREGLVVTVYREVAFTEGTT